VRLHQNLKAEGRQKRGEERGKPNLYLYKHTDLQERRRAPYFSVKKKYGKETDELKGEGGVYRFLLDETEKRKYLGNLSRGKEGEKSKRLGRRTVSNNALTESHQVSPIHLRVNRESHKGSTKTGRHVSSRRKGHRGKALGIKRSAERRHPRVGFSQTILDRKRGGGKFGGSGEKVARDGSEYMLKGRLPSR